MLRIKWENSEKWRNNVQNEKTYENSKASEGGATSPRIILVRLEFGWILRLIFLEKCTKCFVSKWFSRLISIPSLKKLGERICKRTKHFPWDDHFVYSHGLFCSKCMDIARRKLILASLGPSRPRRFRMWRQQACREICWNSKPPLVTRIARTGLGTRLNFGHS